MKKKLAVRHNLNETFWTNWEYARGYSVVVEMKRYSAEHKSISWEMTLSRGGGQFCDII